MPTGIFYTSDGHLLISGGVPNTVSVYQEDGKFVSSIEGFHKGEISFTNPRGIVMLKDGQIVVTSFSDHRLVVY